MQYKNKSLFVFLLLFVMNVFAAEKNDHTFPLELKLNNQLWTLGFNHETDSLQIAEYVTNNETVDEWNQLFTFQHFKMKFPDTVTPISFAQKEISGLTEKGYKPIYQAISTSPKEAIIEFRIEEPKDEQQDELQRIVKMHDDTVVVIHYVIKQANMGDDTRKKWIEILKNFDVNF